MYDGLLVGGPLPGECCCRREGWNKVVEFVEITPTKQGV